MTAKVNTFNVSNYLLVFFTIIMSLIFCNKKQYKNVERETLHNPPPPLTFPSQFASSPRREYNS